MEKDKKKWLKAKDALCLNLYTYFTSEHTPTLSAFATKLPRFLKLLEFGFC